MARSIILKPHIPSAKDSFFQLRLQPHRPIPTGRKEKDKERESAPGVCEIMGSIRHLVYLPTQCAYSSHDMQGLSFFFLCFLFFGGRLERLAFSPGCFPHSSTPRDAFGFIGLGGTRNEEIGQCLELSLFSLLESFFPSQASQIIGGGAGPGVLFLSLPPPPPPVFLSYCWASKVHTYITTWGSTYHAMPCHAHARGRIS